MPLCVECKYMGRHAVINAGYADDDCTHIQAQSTSLVTGNTLFQSCAIMRIDDGVCGPSARLFEHDERPWWRRILNNG